MHQSKLQYRSLRQCFLHILVRNTACDHSDFGVTILHFIDVHGAGIFSHSLQSLLHHQMTLDGVAGHHDIFSNISFIRLILRHYPLFQMNKSLGMCQSGGLPHHDRRIIFLRKLKGSLHKHSCLFTVRGLNYGNHGSPCYHTGVLLIL